VQNLPNITADRKTEKVRQLRFFYARDYERIYRTGKANHSKVRIAGAVRTILKRSGGAKCCPSVSRIMAFTGMSERTVRRYLRSVLEWLSEQGELVLEVHEYKGYVVCTQAWLNKVSVHGDLFEPRRFSRSPWRTRRQLATLPYPPPAKTLISNKNDKSKRIQSRLAPAMMKLASNLLRKSPLPHSNRFHIDPKTAQIALAKLLAGGHCRTVAPDLVFKAVKKADSMVADQLTLTPERYFWVALAKLELLAPPPLPKSFIRSRCRHFWSEQRLEYDRTVRAYPEMAATPGHEKALAFYASKTS
jgi:hypothetical protein